MIQIVKQIGCERIKLLILKENVGQIPAFFAALDQSSGEFVCLLDPDDRYDEDFIGGTLSCHLNEVVFCPIVCTEQRLLAGDCVITGSYSWQNGTRMSYEGGALVIEPRVPRLYFYPPEKRGWFWTSTSSMMFRRAACNIMRPQKALDYKGSFDSYMANGAHMLGGTLFYTKPLVYRGLHQDNAWITAQVYASLQNKQKTYGEERTKECLVDVVEAIQKNGGSIVPQEPVRKRGVAYRLRKSIGKRANKLAEVFAIK